MLSISHMNVIKLDGHLSAWLASCVAYYECFPLTCMGSKLAIWDCFCVESCGDNVDQIGHHKILWWFRATQQALEWFYSKRAIVSANYIAKQLANGPQIVISTRKKSISMFSHQTIVAPLLWDMEKMYGTTHEWLPWVSKGPYDWDSDVGLHWLPNYVSVTHGTSAGAQPTAIIVASSNRTSQSGTPLGWPLLLPLRL